MQRVQRPLRLQRPPRGGQRLRAAVLEHAAQRVQLGLHRLRQRCPQVVEVEQVDVEVAQVAGDLLDALELVAEVLQALRVDRLELALERARAADRDAQVVQELAVDVLERPGQVLRDHLEQPGEDGRGGLGRGLVGVELQVELGARARRAPAGGEHRLVDERERRRRAAAPGRARARPRSRARRSS